MNDLPNLAIGSIPSLLKRRSSTSKPEMPWSVLATHLTTFKPEDVHVSLSTGEVITKYAERKVNSDHLGRKKCHTRCLRRNKREEGQESGSEKVHRHEDGPGISASLFILRLFAGISIATQLYSVYKMLKIGCVKIMVEAHRASVEESWF